MPRLKLSFGLLSSRFSGLNSLRFTTIPHTNSFAKLAIHRPFAFTPTSAVMTNDDNQSKNTPVLFSEKLANLYSYIGKQHFHVDGPFRKITNLVVDYADKNSNIANLVVVDLASGGGQPAGSIAKVINNSTVYSTDISDAMNAMATENLKDIPNVHTKIADMQDLNLLFADNSVDVVTCCYGYMFPPDQNKALQETFRVLKPGGLFVATTWNRLPQFEMFGALSERITGEPYKHGSFNPLSLAEPGLFEEMIIEAGFDKDSLEISTGQYPMDFSNDPEFHVALLRGMDFEKKLQPTDNETILSTFLDLAPKHLKLEEDGTWVAVENIYKCSVAFKPRV